MQPYNSTPKKERRSNAFAITSLVLAMAPFILGVLLIIIFLLVTSGAILGDVGQALWPLFMLFPIAILAVGLVADILAVIFGIIAIRKRNTFFSWLGIIIVAVEVLIFFLI